MAHSSVHWMVDQMERRVVNFMVRGMMWRVVNFMVRRVMHRVVRRPMHWRCVARCIEWRIR